MDEHDAMATHEFHRLERQLREMQQDREMSSHQDKVILAKQKQIIDALQEEKRVIKMAIEMGETTAIVKAQEQATSDIESLIAEERELKRLIDIESKTLKELKVNLRSINDRMIEVRSKYGAKMQSSIEEEKKRELYQESLEAQVHVENEKFSKILTENRKLRQEIDDLLQERGMFNEIFKGVSAELDTGKKIIYDLILQGNHQYDLRREEEVKLTNLRTKAKQDLIRNCSEVQGIKRSAYHGIRLNLFIEKKAQRRIQDLIETSKALKKEEATQAMVEHLDKYRKVIQEIQEKFNETDLDRLVMEFLKLEEDNYNIYTFNNEQNMRLDQLRTEVQELEDKLEEQNKINVRLDEDILFRQKDWENLIARKKLEVEEATNNLKSSRNIIEKLFEGIRSLFEEIDANLEPIMQMLGDNAKVNDRNVAMYLLGLEQRAQDVATYSRYLIERSTPRKTTIAQRKSQGFVLGLSDSKTVTSTTLDFKDVPVKVKTPCPLCVEENEISEVDESIAHPEEMDVLRRKVQQEFGEGAWAGLFHDVADCKLPESRTIIQNRQE